MSLDPVEWYNYLVTFKDTDRILFFMAIDIMTFIDYIEYAFSISTFKVNDINFMRLRFLWKKFVYVASLNIYKR